MKVKKKLRLQLFRYTLQGDHKDFILKDVGGKFLFSCQFSLQSLSLNLPNLYTDIVKSWTELVIEEKGEIDVETVIWNNRNITFQKQSLFSAKFHDAGINKIKHLLTKEMKIIPFKTLVERNVGITWNDYFYWNKIIKSITNLPYAKRGDTSDSDFTEDFILLAWKAFGDWAVNT